MTDDDDKDLFGEPIKRKPVEERTRSRRDDPPTSKAAARKSMFSISDKQKIVEEEFKRHPKGLTDWKLEDILGSHGSTWRTRRDELSDPKWFNPPRIVDSGRTRKEPDSENPKNDRIVWILAEYADPYRLKPMPERAATPPAYKTNAHYDKDGHLIHETCARCNSSEHGAPYSIGAHVSKGQLGMWYCFKCWEQVRKKHA